MVFDHIHKVVYACISERTDRSALIQAVGILGYHVVCFQSNDNN
jgi:hypothetical protein